MASLTVKQIIERLSQYPEDAVVLVEGYETGWDDIHSIRQAVVVEYRKANEWDGEYQEESQFNQPGKSRSAVFIEGCRGHRRKP